MTIGERLLKLRKEKNLSQEELANILDVSRQTVSKWETDQSLPDSDKIIPLCECFGITSDELLTGSTNIIEKKEIDVKNHFARNIAISVMLYICSLIVIILFGAQFNQPIIGVSLFFLFIALATGLIIYNAIYYSKESKKEKSEKRNTIEKQVNGIVDILVLIVYLCVSFLTGAWAITWIIFIVGVLINAIVKLIFAIKGDKKEDTYDEN